MSSNKEGSKHLGNRIRAARKGANLTSDAAAREIGVSGGAWRNWENGNNGPSRKNLEAISDRFNVTLQWLLKDDPVAGPAKKSDSGAEPGVRPDAGVRSSGQLFDSGAEPLPVYTTASMGTESMLVDSVVELAARPAILVGRKNAWGLLIATDAMSPALRPGDVAWVDPLLPPVIDAEVVIARDDDGAIVVATLVAFDDANWTVETYRPEVRRTSLSRKEWPKISRIVGKNARR